MTYEHHAKKNLQNTWHILKHREQVLESEFKKWIKANLKKNANDVHAFHEVIEETEIRPVKNESMERIETELKKLKELVLSTPMLLKEAQKNHKENSITTSLSKQPQECNTFVPLSTKSKFLKSESNIKQAHDLSICIHNSLLMQEKILAQDLKNLETQIKSWEEKPNQDQLKLDDNEKEKKILTNKNTHEIHLKKSASSLPYAVEAFEKFVQQYGMYGGEGWDSSTHTIFLQLKQQLKHPNLYYQRCEEILHKPKHELEVHDMWLDRYTELQKSKKEAIQEWRQFKLKQKETQVHLVEKDIHLTKTKPSFSSSVSIQGEVQQTLMLWKEKRKIEEKKRLEFNEKKRNEALKIEKQRREKKQCVLKKAIEQYQTQKNQLKSSSCSTFKCIPRLNSEALDRIRKQSQRILNKRKPKPVSKKITFDTNQKTKYKHSNIPSKLLFDTISSKLKKDVTLLKQEKMNIAVEKKFQASSAILYVQKLGKPSWKSD
ncbi:hypothetical protein HMI54_004496 [Coelomomyces lativittatus]|nr:hypothetical protein HMI54_004496 [Coelomomyces lativittatus]KAJ1513520.1 hypothetical protein HMI55_005500 [Coelomomyces lativittatus]KAJ1515956.1 hypothetical protein HMI56_003923 [Coelomomyces lativittatus]